MTKDIKVDWKQGIDLTMGIYNLTFILSKLRDKK
jgi:hypothetical protein